MHTGLENLRTLPSPSNFMRHFYRSFSARLALVSFIVFLLISILSRVILTLKASHDVSWDLSLVGSFLYGFYFDLAAGVFAAVLWFVFGLLFPKRLLGTRTASYLIAGAMTLYVSLLIFITASEWFFWDEFGVRFNFIAVDYLIWTQEVLGNIMESYPMGPIMAGIVGLGIGLTWLLSKKGLIAWVLAGERDWNGRIGGTAVGIALAGLAFVFVSQAAMPSFVNQFNGEIAKNGPWSFFAAARKMELDYEEWYPSLPQAEALAGGKKLLVTENAVAVTDSNEDFRRRITGRGAEKRWNVMMICMESFGADLMAYTGDTRNLSPNLDRFSEKSVFFENLYATGTRTVRGMEALTLNLPPTPGASILYRPEGTDLVTNFTPFLERGYDCAFLYGGDGRFDYMNRFFATSGVRIMDVKAWEDEDTTFKTSWGACDEDLFNKAISEGDKAYEEGKPFHYFCMTTSNHRPYEFPGKPGLEPHSGPKPEVRYADWAVGDLIENARKRPWFKDTIFIFCADHCSSSAGKAELNVTKFHIPAMIYNPGIVPARKISDLCSQIDVMPTVFGLLNWNYDTLGFGYDRLAPTAESLPERAFISNYQKVALLTPDSLVILKPKSPTSFYDCDLRSGELTVAGRGSKERLLRDAIFSYQSASWIFNSGRLKDPKKK